MKNFPHQFNDLSKLFKALKIVKEFEKREMALTDENFGERLTRDGIYTYRDRELTIDEFLKRELEKPLANRGYLTVSRDIRRFLELLGFITLFPNKNIRLSASANQLLSVKSEDSKKELWKNALLQLCLEGTDGEISHPYRILLKLVNMQPGIETSKLMLALEAENDTDEEYERILYLSQKTIKEIIIDTGTTESMAKNAVKILPGIAEQLGDIERINNQSFPVGEIIITEDEITTEKEFAKRTKAKLNYRETNAEDFAKDPNLKNITSISIDLTEAIKIRQKRLAEHQDIVRLLALLHVKYDFKLYEGKFDCLAIKGDNSILYEVKTILKSASDEEKQVVKGVGQLKYYKFSIVHKQMGCTKINEVLVFSQKPEIGIIEFCEFEKITVIWRVNNKFYTYNLLKSEEEEFNPNNFI